VRRSLTRREVAAVVVAVGLVVAGFGAGLALGSDGSDGSDDGGTGDGAQRGGSSDGATAAAPPVSVADGPAMEQVPPEDPEKGTRQGSPLDDLPAGVRTVTDVGQRPDWSPDGDSIVYLDDSPLGEVWTVDVETGEARNVTEDLDHHGFSRAYYLSNGDLLLCGPSSGPLPSAERPEAGRFTGVMSVFRAPFDEPPVPLGMPCWEGMATSRTSLRIAWNRSDIDYTDSDLVDRVVNGITEIWTGELRYDGDRVAVVDARKVLDRDAFGQLAVFEVQGFRPLGDHDELILTAYAYQGGEVLGLDLGSGTLRNYSNSSAYEEAEGVDVTGDAVYVERDLEYTGVDPGALDIWRLGLDDASWERVTTFNRYAPYYASNPAVSPDGERLAFQLSIDGETEGQGDGILLLDLP
jgi:WD40-like Beta Propeller Repeat